LKLLGEGTIATAFLARETEPERLVALKVLKSNFAAEPTLRIRFQNAAIAAASIVHPNVAATYRTGDRPDGLPYVAQEYIGGESLAALLLRSERRIQDESARMIASLAKALAAAQDKAIIHGAVNPGNVFIERDSGRLVLTDFGIAGLRTIGKDARYTSPEQLRGETATAASDIYSLGVIASELAADNESEEHAELLKQCLDENPDARPSAQALVQELVGHERTAERLDLNQPTQQAAEKSLMRVAVIAGLIIMAIGAAVGFAVYAHYSEALQ
jgi:serine/threonine-protein kinase